MATSLKGKLKLPEAHAHLLFYNAPQGYIPLLDLPSIFEIHEDLKGAYQWAQLFAYGISELETFFPKVYSASNKGAIIWLSFPKRTSKLRGDLSRDNGWEVSNKFPCQLLQLISINNDWSAFSIRKGKADAGKHPKAGKHNTDNDKINVWIDKATRTITLPDDLKKELAVHSAAKEFFETLSYSHRREYITWIIEAKKVETRQARISKLIERLKAGEKNLTVK